MLPPVAAKKEAVEAVQQQIHQQRKIIDRCKDENHALRHELTSRTKVLILCHHEKLSRSAARVLAGGVSAA